MKRILILVLANILMWGSLAWALSGSYHVPLQEGEALPVAICLILELAGAITGVYGLTLPKDA